MDAQLLQGGGVWFKSGWMVARQSLERLRDHPQSVQTEKLILCSTRMAIIFENNRKIECKYFQAIAVWMVGGGIGGMLWKMLYGGFDANFSQTLVTVPKDRFVKCGWRRCINVKLYEAVNAPQSNLSALLFALHDKNNFEVGRYVAS